MSASYCGEVTIQDVERSSTLTRRDLGKHVVVANGCVYLRDTKEEALELVCEIQAPGPMGRHA